jgi:eukaryotic-like serine/threonine-protein kinase
MSESGEKLRIRLPKALYGYDIVDFLGEGAGSLIYAATNPADGQICALKHVVVKKEKDVRFVEQLVNEYEVSRKVAHPMLRKCLDLRVTKRLLGKPTEAALIMERVQGTACDLVPPRGVENIVRIMEHTASALHAMHQQGNVHCDLKPNNILVTSDGGVKIIDLGQACAIGTVKKRIQGTPDFIAPEQVRCEPATVQTDVYNLGATFYWMLTGSKVPTLFTIKRGENSFLLPAAVPDPASLNPRVPRGLSNLIMECVNSAPNRRPSGMQEVLRRLDVIKSVLDGIAQAQAAKAAEAAAPVVAPLDRKAEIMQERAEIWDETPEAADRELPPAMGGEPAQA